MPLKVSSCAENMFCTICYHYHTLQEPIGTYETYSFYCISLSDEILRGARCIKLPRPLSGQKKR